ncbi:hypothetical protein FACS189481_1680 [Clostridia bacterium]|nr:hypothetical protein FACS189481_1680 [Clostridia bacterium]
MKRFFAALNFAFLLILSASLIVSAEVVSDNFESFENSNVDWAQYVNLTPYTHPHLNNAILNGKKILARDVLSLDNGTVVYRAHGVRTLKVKIFHNSGTFATITTIDPTPEESKYILGNEADLCRDPFKVYYCKKEDKLYLNHRNKEWRECYFDLASSSYQFKKSNSEFHIENFGQDLVFYGVNVYTSDDNFEFKIVHDCTIESVDKVQLFTIGAKYYAEELSFAIPENVTSIKVVLSNFDHYFENGQKKELSDTQQKTFILLAGIDLIGDKINLDYYGDPGEPVNGKEIKIKEKKPKKVKEPKPTKVKVLKEEREEKREKKKEEKEETVEDEKFQVVSKTTHSDIITVDPEPAINEVAANVEPEEIKPRKKKNPKKIKEKKKRASRKKRKTAKKVAEKSPVPQNEEKAIFLKTDSNRQKKLPQSNKLLGTSYVLSASGVVLWLAFEDHLKTWASKALSYLARFKR